MKIFLGVDGGGTKTQVSRLVPDNESLNADFTAGPSNYQAVGFEEAIANIKSALHQALDDLAEPEVYAFLALAGVDTTKDKQIWQDSIHQDGYLSTNFFNRIEVGNDIQAALRSGSKSKNALAIISGTGSACFGRNDKGETAKTSGMNQILADQGCGYDLGLQALKQITKELDGRSPRGVMTDLFFQKYSIDSLPELNDLIYGKDVAETWDKSKIGEVALIVHEAADQQDPWALWACEQAVMELTQMVKGTISRLGIEQTPFDLVCVGSILTKFDQIKNLFRAKIQEIYPQVVLREPTMEPARAAALLAQEMPEAR